MSVYSSQQQGSQAYAKALSKAGILTKEEAATIVDGLDKVCQGSVRVWVGTLAFVFVFVFVCLGGMLRGWQRFVELCQC